MKKMLTLGTLAIGGAAYMTAFSFLDLHYLLKYELVLLPVQLGVFVYLFWWKNRES